MRAEAAGDVTTAGTEPRGAQARVTTALTTQPLSLDPALAAVADPGAGGVVVFAGTVRDEADGDPVRALTYEAWEEQAEAAMRSVADAVLADHPDVRAVHLSHRLGRLEVGEVSVVVAASAPHRAEAFAAGRALIDALKAAVPIWKAEELVEGGTRWPGSPDV